VRRSEAFALASILFVAAVIRLSPLLSAVFWGSDFGEYLAILRALADDGRVPASYAGWGRTYPFFPGMFLMQASLVELGGLSLPAVLNLVVPVLGAFAVVPVYLIAARITGDARASLFAAAFVAVAMPHAYPTSHAAPASLGDLLALAGLMMFLRLRNDSRIAGPLVLTTAALVATHHLSTYFLLIMVLATVVLRGLVRPLRTSNGLVREVGYMAFFLLATFSFWLGYAIPFRDYILTDVNVQPWWALLVAFAGLLALVAGVIVARRRLPWRYRPRYPRARRSAGMFLLALASVLGLMVLSVVGTIPGTGISLPPSVFLYFGPFAVLAALSSAGRKVLDFQREGLAVSSWVIALVASALLGTVAATRVLIPYRHVEYLIVPVALLAGVGFFHLLDLTATPKRHRYGALVACGLLLAANAFVAIPPPNLVAGWDEGAYSPSLTGALWAQGHVDGLVLADHRASTILFGLAGVNGTWDTTESPFFAADFEAARSGLVDVPSPSGLTTVSYVWLDRDEIAGVQLRPWEPALPMAPSAVAMLSGPPFIKVFDNGYAQVYWIAWGCDDPLAGC